MRILRAKRVGRVPLSASPERKVDFRRRGSHGAALVEGVVSLVMITIGTVAAVTLLVNAGMSTYYKEKIGFVANQCATYAASLSPGDDLEGKTSLLAKKLVAAMGMPNNAVTVKVAEMPIEDRVGLKVTLCVGGLGMFGSGDIMPKVLSMQDTAVSLRNGTPSGYLWMNNNPKFSGYLIPVVKVPPSGPNSLGMPLYIP
ncbi:hypothetical protein KBI23_21370 [bacterium]|nr:hypothetical protein [bacterium]